MIVYKTVWGKVFLKEVHVGYGSYCLITIKYLNIQ